MRLYVAGPMTGIENYNFPAFDAAAKRLAELGHDPLNPADFDRARGYVTEKDGVVETTSSFSLEAALSMDFAAIISAQGIVLLPGWETSRGAQKERRVAEDLGRKIFHLIDGELVEERLWIVGLTGYAQVGKDTVGGIMKGLGFERLSFADGVREGMYALNPIVAHGSLTVEDVLSPGPIRLREIVDRIGWEKAKQISEIRQLLQRYGTEAGREIFGSDCWIQRALDKAEPFLAYVVTDVRFPNEAEAIRAKGGEIWRVDRPGYAPINSHASDVSVDEIEPDRIIVNDGTVQELEALVSLAVADFDRLYS